MPKQVITRGLRLAAYGNCVINNWTDAPGPEEFSAFEAFLSQVAGEYKGHIAFFVVVDPSTPIITTDQRKQMEAIYTRWGSSLSAVAGLL